MCIVYQPEVIIEPRKFYVYVYLDPRKPGKFVYSDYKFDYEPFYVGKGHAKRLYEHFEKWYIKNDKNKSKTNKIKKIIEETRNNPIVIKYRENLTEQEAFDLEKKMISVIGRKDLGRGPLVNLTDGGEGATGYVYSIKERLKRSINSKGNKGYWFGKHFSEDHKKKVSISKTGLRHKRSTIDKIKETMNESSVKNQMSNSHKVWNFLRSDYKSWSEFTKNERYYIYLKFRRKQTNTIIYKNITITRMEFI
jgi:hypothetical protein